MEPVRASHEPLRANQPLPTRIYLTGFMGCGKSTVGRRLAEALGYDFLDLDALIEAAAGCSIPALFEARGEAAFRVLEAAQLRATEAYERAVIALGGGALTFEENLVWALAHGTVVYLEASVDVLLHRLLDERAGRPMLYDAAGHPHAPETLRARIEDLLSRRTPFYQRAHFTLDASLPADAVASKITKTVTLAGEADQKKRGD